MPPKLPSKAESVKVVVRCRPLDNKEKKAGHESCVKFFTDRGVIEAKNPKTGTTEPPKTFTYDSIYDWDSKQKDLYDETFRDLVQAVLDGFNGTIFAYGQTGTGKTFTMQGVKNDPVLKGVIPHSFEHIFGTIARSENQQYLVRASYLEIYMEEIRDLLSKDQSKRLELKERPDTGVLCQGKIALIERPGTSIYVKDLSSFVTKSIKEIEHVMNVGNQNRSVGATDMNEHSSRSHAIFIITVECSETGIDGENHIRVGKLNLVDLAGSERQAKTGATGDRLKEATKINLSLSALGNVISALVDGKSSHIPYRDSKLTRLLQDSLGGNAKTVMVANIGPADWNYDETITTLRYANRAKNIKNKPKINEDPKDALLREFQEEIARLKNALTGKGGGGGGKKGKRKKRIGENGETLSDDDDDDEDDDGTGEDEFIQEQRNKLEKEKEDIMNNHNLIAAEKEKLLEAMMDKETKLAKEREVKEALQKKIAAMEGKLLCGGKNIIDHTNEQQRALDQKQHEIMEQEKREREIQQALEKQDETALNIQETYTSLQQEVEIKTKKLKKLFAKLQATKQEIQDLAEEHVRERQELEQTQNELTRELKLKMLIIDNFIPHEEKEKLTERAVFDEEEDSWKMQQLTKQGALTMVQRPMSAVGNKRPVSEYARMAASMGGSIRYKGENILQVELDMPNRTTRDYEGPTVAPKIQAALDAALQDEEDIDIDGSPAVFSSKAKPAKGKKSGIARPKTSSRPAHEVFPQTRGLVRK